MRDISGSTIINFGTSTVDMKLGDPDDEASCRVALQVGAVSKNSCLSGQDEHWELSIGNGC